MKKYKITTAKNAVEKGLLNEGDKFTVEFIAEKLIAELKKVLCIAFWMPKSASLSPN